MMENTPSSPILFHHEFSHQESVFKIERTHDLIKVSIKMANDWILVSEWDTFNQDGYYNLSGNKKVYKRFHYWKKIVEKETGFSSWESLISFTLPKPFITIDPTFKPVIRRRSNGGYDETFRFQAYQWNITMMEEWIADNMESIGMKKKEVTSDLVNYIKSGIISTNPEHVGCVDLEKPIILAQIQPEWEGSTGEMIIDGHHRILKASQEGVSTLNAYVLTIEQNLPFLMQTLDETYAYRTLLHQWNNMIEMIITSKNEASNSKGEQK